MNDLPKASAFQLADALNRVDEAEACDAVELDAQAIARKLIDERDLRRANAIESVRLARLHDGRDAEPWSAHDAGVAYAIADLLHCASGRGVEPRPATAKARPAAPSARTLDPRIEAGILGGAVSASIGDAG